MGKVGIDPVAMIARKDKIVGQFTGGIAGLFKKNGVAWLQGTARGITGHHRGSDDLSREIGIEPETGFMGPMGAWDETVYYGGYRAWKQFIKDGLEADGLL